MRGLDYRGRREAAFGSPQTPGREKVRTGSKTPKRITGVDRWCIVTTKTAWDRIRLAGVKLRPRLGVTPEERGTSQECEADLTLWMDFEAAAATDALDNSIDYCRVLETARRVAEACEYRLLETLAYRIARALLGEFPVHRVGLKLRKRPESLRGRVDFVEVEVEEP